MCVCVCVLCVRVLSECVYVCMSQKVLDLVNSLQTTHSRSGKR